MINEGQFETVNPGSSLVSVEFPCILLKWGTNKKQTQFTEGEYKVCPGLEIFIILQLHNSSHILKRGDGQKTENRIHTQHTGCV